MFKKIILILVAIAALSFVFSVEAATGCKKFNVAGSYTRPNFGNDIWGDGTTHNYIFQLNLNDDGTAIQFWTGASDYILNTGTAAPWAGSWKCRDDGKLVLTLIEANNYSPVAAGTHPGQTLPDIELTSYIRSTSLFSVDANTLTRLQVRSRFYLPNEDPTDPTGGTLGTLFTTPATYTRVQASDADLNLP